MVLEQKHNNLNDLDQEDRPTFKRLSLFQRTPEPSETATPKDPLPKATA